MKGFHRIVVSFGVCAIVTLVTLAGTAAQATNHRPSKAVSSSSLVETIRHHNASASGCRE